MSRLLNAYGYAPVLPVLDLSEDKAMELAYLMHMGITG